MVLSIYSYLIILVVYQAFCLDVAQGRMNAALLDKLANQLYNNCNLHSCIVVVVG